MTAVPRPSAALVPPALVGLRFALGPVVYVAIAHQAPAAVVVTLLTAGFCSDVFDGVIARRLGTATPALRKADSYVDICYYAWVAAAAWLAAPGVIAAYAWPLVGLAVLQLLCWGLDVAKYGRIATYHAYSAKAWGIALFLVSAAVLGFRTDGPFVWLMIAAGVVSLLEGIAMTWVLPSWTHDVWHLGQAIALAHAQTASRDGAR